MLTDVDNNQEENCDQRNQLHNAISHLKQQKKSGKFTANIGRRNILTCFCRPPKQEFVAKKCTEITVTDVNNIFCL